MKLYLSSYRLPVPEELSKLVGKPLKSIKLSLIPNAKDYYADRARNVKVDSYITYFQKIGINPQTVDLRNLNNADEVKMKLKGYDVVWALGGNTFCLRYEMHRSGFDDAVKWLLDNGVVYGGDSAGALVAGAKIGGFGIELVDTPEFAKTVIDDGLGLVPFILLPHADSPGITEITQQIRENIKNEAVIELKDSQAVIFENSNHYLVNSKQ